eukprot:s686_g17.t1
MQQRWRVRMDNSGSAFEGLDGYCFEEAEATRHSVEILPFVMHTYGGPDDGKSGIFRHFDLAAEAARLHVTCMLFVHFYSGYRRDGDLQHCIELQAQAGNMHIFCISIDLCLAKKHSDLTDQNTKQFWIGKMRGGQIIGVGGGPSCETWSAARHRPPGPGPVRSYDHPWGIAGLRKKQWRQVTVGTVLVQFLVDLLWEATTLGLCGFLEHPQFPLWLMRERPASIWSLKVMSMLSKLSCYQVCSFDQCIFGLSAKKPTTLLLLRLSTFQDIVLTRGARGRCNHGAAHQPLHGIQANGEFYTARAKIYPRAMNNAVALAVCSSGACCAWCASGDGPIARWFPNAAASANESCADGPSNSVQTRFTPSRSSASPRWECLRAIPGESSPRECKAEQHECDWTADPHVVSIAKKLKRNPGEVLSRWLLQLGMAVVVSDPEEHRGALDFQLQEEEMRLLNGLVTLSSSVPGIPGPGFAEDVYGLRRFDHRAKEAPAGDFPGGFSKPFAFPARAAKKSTGKGWGQEDHRLVAAILALYFAITYQAPKAPLVLRASRSEEVIVTPEPRGKVAGQLCAYFSSTVTAAETPPKTEDPRILKLKQLKQLGSLMHTLVHLKKMKELKESASKIASSACVDNWDTLPLHDPMGDPQHALGDDHAEGHEVAVVTKSLETMSLRGDQEVGEVSHQGAKQVESPPMVQEFDQTEMMGGSEPEVSNKGVTNQVMASGVEQEQVTAPIQLETTVHKETKDPVETPEEQATVEGTTDNKERDLMSTLTFANGKTLEAVKADTWISQAESKAVLRKVKSNKRLTPEEPESSSLPKPESWGQVPHLSPDEQCPPKKRGRKPKADTNSAPATAKTSETTKVSKTKARKGSTTKAEKGTKKDSKQGDADNTGGSPSQRLQAYLKEQKKKRKASEEEPKAPSKKKRIQKTADVETPEESAAGEARPKKRQYKRKAKQPSAETDAQQGDMHVAEVNGPEVEARQEEQQTEQPQTDPTEDPALARKKKQSRKSSAYHVAYRATQGSEEEKRAAAKKVSKQVMIL